MEDMYNFGKTYNEQPEQQWEQYNPTHVNNLYNIKPYAYYAGSQSPYPLQKRGAM
jgi:hypothetical protein